MRAADTARRCRVSSRCLRAPLRSRSRCTPSGHGTRKRPRAWHAGVSEYRGRSGCNDFSIGVELEGTDSTPYTDAQYRQLASLTLALLEAYPSMSTDRIAGHADVAPDRKSDPWATFDWPRYRALLQVKRDAPGVA